MDSELRVHFHKQMHMIRHDLHLDDVDAKFLTGFLYQFFQANIYTIDQYLSAIFWTPDHMVFAGVHHIMITFVLNEKIILLYLI